MTMGPLRPESSVSPTKDEYGEIVFPGCGNGAVIHRTPEELGIPRVVSDAPKFVLPHLAAIVAAAPEALRTARWQTGATLETIERRLGLRSAEPRKAKRQRDSLDGVKPRVVIGASGRGVEVRMSAHAVMGAELIDVLAADPEPEKAPAGEEEKVKVMPNNSFDMQSEVNRKIVAAPVETPARVLAKELGCQASRVYGVRSQAYREGSLQKRSASEIGKATGGVRRSAVDGAAKPIAAKNGGRPKKTLADREAARQLAAAGPGYGPALSLALARHDSRAVRTIRLELSEMEVAVLVGKLSDEQRGAFLAAGLKAAILGWFLTTFDQC